MVFKGSRLYNIWTNIKQRCGNPRSHNFKHYGGRGISVCKKWRDSFLVFREWAIANGYRPHLTIDRKNNSGNYSPRNCRWITHKQQCRNRRDNAPVILRGKKVLLPVLAERYRILESTLRSRIFQSGWSVERAVTAPVRGR